MSDDPGNLTLIYLRRLDAKMDRLAETVADIGRRLTTLETVVGNLASAEMSHYAIAMQRFDGIDKQLARIERRLDLVDDPSSA